MWVSVIYDGLRYRYVFPCDQWLSTKKGDGQIARELLPHDPSRKKSVADAALEDQGQLCTAYSITSLALMLMFLMCTYSNLFCIKVQHKKYKTIIIIIIIKCSSGRKGSGDRCREEVCQVQRFVIQPYFYSGGCRVSWPIGGRRSSFYYRDWQKNDF